MSDSQPDAKLGCGCLILAVMLVVFLGYLALKLAVTVFGPLPMVVS